MTTKFEKYKINALCKLLYTENLRISSVFPEVNAVSSSCEINKNFLSDLKGLLFNAMVVTKALEFIALDYVHTPEDLNITKALQDAYEEYKIEITLGNDPAYLSDKDIIDFFDQRNIYPFESRIRKAIKINTDTSDDKLDLAAQISQTIASAHHNADMHNHRIRELPEDRHASNKINHIFCQIVHNLGTKYSLTEGQIQDFQKRFTNPIYNIVH